MMIKWCLIITLFPLTVIRELDAKTKVQLNKYFEICTYNRGLVAKFSEKNRNENSSES